jgi:3-phenylpropionate/trans-cinnamate dioxygenase ferredoxin reductase subunit
MSVVIVGAGQAGGNVARTLRAEGYTGSIALFGEEDHPPYERPPLSKEFLQSKCQTETFRVFKSGELDSLAVELVLGKRVIGLERSRKTIRFEDGNERNYDQLVLATGARPVRLAVPGGDRPPVQVLRTMDDALRLRKQFEAAKKIVVVGGGWIGMEVASTARELGLAVVLIEAGPRLCTRAAPPALSHWLADFHRSHGVDVRVGISVSAVERVGRKAEVVLSDGSGVVADTVVVGIGVRANDELAESSGLAVSGGIVTDPFGRTADAAVFACGDVATYRHPLLTRQTTLESWENANLQSRACALALLGRDSRRTEAPWFWSDQYDRNIQMVGDPTAGEAYAVRGDPRSQRFVLFAFVGSRIVGAISVNAARDLRVAKQLVERQVSVPIGAVEDPSTDLREFLSSVSSSIPGQNQ